MKTIIIIEERFVEMFKKELFLGKILFTYAPIYVYVFWGCDTTGLPKIKPRFFNCLVNF